MKNKQYQSQEIGKDNGQRHRVDYSALRSSGFTNLPFLALSAIPAGIYQRVLNMVMNRLPDMGFGQVVGWRLSE